MDNGAVLDWQSLPEVTDAEELLAGRRYYTIRGKEILILSVANPIRCKAVKGTQHCEFTLADAVRLYGPVPEGDQDPTDKDNARSTTMSTKNAPKKDKVEKKATAKAAPVEKEAKARDARMPDVGTPIEKTWRGKKVVAVEQADGTFHLTIDKKTVTKDAKSLTGCAMAALATEGLTSPVNGFAWFKVGVAPKAAKAEAAE